MGLRSSVGLTKKPTATLVARLVIGITILLVIAVAYGYSQSPIRSDASNGTGLHNVTFLQLPSCGNGTTWGEPWAVTFAGQTKSQPPNTPMAHDGGLYGTLNGSLSSITFVAGWGLYTFSVAPASLLVPSSGMVRVTDADVTIQLSQVSQCPTSTTTRGPSP